MTRAFSNQCSCTCNSGGALVDECGNVVGVICAKLSATRPSLVGHFLKCQLRSEKQLSSPLHRVSSTVSEAQAKMSALF
jgi:hypothetical protein